MNNKKLEDMIKNGIDIEFEDISKKLSSISNEKKIIKKMPLRLCISLCIIILLISISFQYVTDFSNNKEDIKENNILYVNEINYKTLSGMINSEIENDLSINYISLKEMSKIFSYDFNLDEDKISTLYCKTNSQNNEIEQCELIYEHNEKLIYINIKYNNYPTFTTELLDSWDENIKNEDLVISKIKDKDLIIIKNLDNNKFISTYYNDNVSNYRTKIMIENLGISFESYDIPLETFVSYIEKFI